jgi:hypothetical protein
MTKTVTISNAAGGDARNFRVGPDGQLSDAGLRHARRQGFGGPRFEGPGAEEAARTYREQEEELDR